MTNDDDEANAGDAAGADKDRVGGTGGGDDASRAGRDDGSGGDVVQNDAGCDVDVSKGAELNLADDSADDNVFGGNSNDAGWGTTTRGRRRLRCRPTSTEEDCAVVSRTSLSTRRAIYYC